MIDLTVEKEVLLLICQKIKKNPIGFLEIAIVCLVYSVVGSLISASIDALIKDKQGMYIELLMGFYQVIGIALNSIILGVITTLFFVRLYIDNTNISIRKVLSLISFKSLLNREAMMYMLFTATIMFVSVFFSMSNDDKGGSDLTLASDYSLASVFLLILSGVLMVVIGYVVTYVTAGVMYLCMSNIGHGFIYKRERYLSNVLYGKYLLVAIRISFVVSGIFVLLLCLGLDGNNISWVLRYVTTTATLLFCGCFAHSAGVRPTPKEKVTASSLAIQS